MCPNCNNSNGPRVIGGISQILATVNSPCTSSLCSSPQDSKCTFYTAGNLPCSGILTKDSIELALQKIDTALCASTGNYSTYNTFCLAPITTQQEFVEKISQYVCTQTDNFNNFTTIAFPSFQDSVTNSLSLLQVPGTASNCSNLSVTPTDTLQVVLQKLSNATCDIYSTQLNLTGVNWAQCFTVSQTPTTIAQGFGVVLSQICSLAQTGGVALPTFNNTGSCLPGTLTATDTLFDTVTKIRTRLCQTPTFDINAFSWNCITKPNNNTTDLQSAFASLMAKVDSLSQKSVTFSGDFAVNATDPLVPCSGKTISLSTSIADRKVAATSSDNTPGTLQDKLSSDSNFAWDYTDPTKAKLTLIGGGGGVSDGKVKTDVADTSGYLDTKIASGGLTNGVQVIASLDTSNPSNHVIKLNAQVDVVALFTAILNSLPSNPTLQQALCAAVAGCPSSCSAPSNVSIVFGGPTTSSTTTTTTTAAPTTTTSTTTSTTTTGVPTTTTSSTTSTTTTAPLDDIFVFAQATGATPSSSTILAGVHSLQNGANDVNADWTPFNTSSQFCVVAIPNRGGTYTKTKWFVDIINNGNIGGGGDAFSAPVVVSVSGNPYNVYITSFATTFTNNCQMKA